MKIRYRNIQVSVGYLPHGLTYLTLSGAYAYVILIQTSILHIYARLSQYIYTYILLYNLNYTLYEIYRRKFGSQTSDNMDKWKAEMRRVREKRRAEERRAEERRSKKRKCEKVGKSRNTVFLRWFVAPAGLAKAAGAEPAERWKIARC